MRHIIQRISEIFEDPYNDSASDFWNLLSDHDYAWETFENDEGHVNVELIDNEDGDCLYHVDDDTASDFWRRIPGYMAEEIKVLFEGRPRRKTVVGDATKIPFPDRRAA